MKQVFFHATIGPIIEDVPAPVCLDYGVLVQVQYSLISSGTETRAGGMVETNEGTAAQIAKNVGLATKVAKKVVNDGVKKTIDVINMVRNRMEPVGYSAAGAVIEVGKFVQDISVGDRVVCGGMGFANHAEIIYTPRNLLCKLPDTLSSREACFTTVASVALQGVRQTRVMFGENVAVIGLGLIGLLAVQILKAAGARVIGFDLVQKRVDLAKALGADQAFNLADADPVAETQHFTEHIGADCVMLTAQTSSTDPINIAVELARVRGRVVVVGSSGLHIDQVNSFFGKEVEIIASHAYGPGRYDVQYEQKGVDYPVGYVRWTLNRNMQEFVRLIDEKKVDVNPLIDHEYPVEKVADAYANFLGKQERPIGIVLKYSEVMENKLKRTYQVTAVKGKKGTLNGAIIGCGQWSLMHHVPNLIAAKDVHLKAVMGQTGIKIKQTAAKYKIDCYTTDYGDILRDPAIDFVIIASRNNVHYKIAKEAIKAGKHVLLEKPMAMTREEMEDLAETVEKGNVHFGVGFNRRYSPFARKIKDELRKEDGPVMIFYRVNGGPHAKGHWSQDPVEGGGLIIGECCHYFDFFNYMVGKDIADVKVTSIPIDGKAVFSNHDNFVVTIKYKDNSAASVFYSSLGASDLEKEYVEVHYNHNVSVISDYKKLQFFGKRQDKLVIEQDKGMKSELEEFIKLLRGEKSEFISLEDSVKATNLCFDVIDLIQQEKHY